MLGIILYVKYLTTRRLLQLGISLVFSLYFGIKFNLFLNLKNCPNCYGMELCHFFNERQIGIAWTGWISFVFHPKLTKSVFHGVVNETKLIVFKRKHMGHRKLTTTDLDAVREKYMLSEDEEPHNVILCPGFGDLEPLFRHLYDDECKGHLWLELSSSIEPLLLKYFQKTGQFPVPRYFGACGDFIFEEDKGNSLTDYLSSDFQTRAHLSAELLKMAHVFTFGSPEFVFYFTDVSQYNLAVDSNGKVSLIDLDNVIIFDRRKYESDTKREVHRSEILDDYEYAYSPSDICNHYLSDHNYFTVCVHLLAHPENGLLREIPMNVTATYPTIPDLLKECTEPTVRSDGRIRAGEKLQVLLEGLTRDYKVPY
ncbi:hypothetical protein RUM44_007204 [Polyplax serrata]|uniref:FAM69 protein-kinase domain-containing protein n=1 Tax=Polyplax serrata TaxID=468196 RepID=A0ABR1B0I1_POLSC